MRTWSRALNLARQRETVVCDRGCPARREPFSASRRAAATVAHVRWRNRQTKAGRTLMTARQAPQRKRRIWITLRVPWVPRRTRGRRSWTCGRERWQCGHSAGRTTSGFSNARACASSLTICSATTVPPFCFEGTAFLRQRVISSNLPFRDTLFMLRGSPPDRARSTQNAGSHLFSYVYCCFWIARPVLSRLLLG